MKIKERATIHVLAKGLSDVFRPSYFPLLGIVLLLLFSYLSLLPWGLKLSLLLMVAFWTLLLPSLGVRAYRRFTNKSRQDLLLRRNRIVPYVIHILCYGCLLHLLHRISVPTFLESMIIISLLVQCVCTIVTLWWKISMHSAGVGAIMGAIVAYSVMFNFNPVWWLCLSIFVSGLVNSSRMLLRQHTLGQVLGGTLVGFLCGLIGLYI